jgi:hypothetical protein
MGYCSAETHRQSGGWISFAGWLLLQLHAIASVSKSLHNMVEGFVWMREVLSDSVWVSFNNHKAGRSWVDLTCNSQQRHINALAYYDIPWN